MGGYVPESGTSDLLWVYEGTYHALGGGEGGEDGGGGGGDDGEWGEGVQDPSHGVH